MALLCFFLGYRVVVVFFELLMGVYIMRRFYGFSEEAALSKYNMERNIFFLRLHGVTFISRNIIIHAGIFLRNVSDRLLYIR